MMESLAASGYTETSVGQVCVLAGVSKRTFYEHFSNKEACFVRLAEMMLHRLLSVMLDACQGGEKSLEARIEIGIRAFLEEADWNSNGIGFLLMQMPTRAPEGWVGVNRLVAEIRRAMLSSLEKSPELGATTAPITAPVGRCVVGGLRWMVTMRLQQRCMNDVDFVAREMSEWVKLVQSPVAIAIENPPRVPRRRNRQAETGPTEDSARLQQAVLASIAEGSKALSPASTASDARLALGRFYELFETRDQCVVCAFRALGEELLQILRGITMPSEDWTVRTYNRVASLLSHLAATPVYAEALTNAPRVLGSVGVRCNLALTLDIATLLCEEAPSKLRVDPGIEGIAGAFSCIVSTAVEEGRVRLLPTQAPLLTYFVLAPFHNAEIAISEINRAVGR